MDYFCATSKARLLEIAFDLIRFGKQNDFADDACCSRPKIPFT